MVHIIKVYYQDQNNEQQIRRLAVSSEIVGNFDLLAWKIRELFPAIKDTNFDVTWKDSENDVIHMSSDEELAQALANAEEGLLRIYVKMPNGHNPKEQDIPKAKAASNELHQLVVCDGCDKEIYGSRYKCLQCYNYDLCSTCNTADKHPEHDMIKLVRPTQVNRNWVFLGARKMWRSMFGRCPASQLPFHRENPKEGSPTKESSSTNSEKPQDGKNQWRNVVDDLLKGDFVPAEKLVKENLGHFLNFVESFADVDVRIEKPNFGDMKKQPAGEDLNKNKENTSSETKLPECSSPEFPLFHNIEKADVEKTKVSETKCEAEVSHSKSEPIIKTDVRKNSNENMPSTSGATAASNTTGTIKKDFSPTGLFSDFETSVNVDGWTLVHDNEVEKKESSPPAAPQNIDGPELLENSIYPNIATNVDSCETSQDQASVDQAQDVTRPKEAVPVSQDPEIMNALIKMQAMGFTNEGGWLERLLITKNGNINSALDALYPNTRRN